MTDDLGYTPGSGASIATDNVGGKHYQRMKVVTGPDGTVTGDVSPSNPLPTTDAAVLDALLRLLNMTRYPQGYDTTLNRTRGTVVVESGTIGSATIASGTITTVTTVTTVAGITNFGNYTAQQAQDAWNRSAWFDTVRVRIT